MGCWKIKCEGKGGENVNRSKGEERGERREGERRGEERREGERRGRGGSLLERQKKESSGK